MRKIFWQWAGVVILTLIGWGVDVMPHNTSWIPSIIIWSVAFVWLIVTVICWMTHEKRVEQIGNEARQEKIKFRQEYIEKKQLPDKLRELDTYLANKIKQQNLPAKTLISMSKTWLKWYDIPSVLFAGVTYALPIIRRIFIKMHVSFVIRFATRMNISLRDYKLGTLPTVETDETYKDIYEQILKLENGLPPCITVKIHRFISLSILLNCLRLLSPERKYWKHLEAKMIKAQKWVRQFRYLKNSLSILLLPLDNTMTALCAEISKDIEGYFVGD